VRYDPAMEKSPVDELVEQIVALRRVLDTIDDADERRRLARVIRQLRRRLGVTVPKHRAAACLGVSAQALEHWVGAGVIPVTRKPGSSRELIDSEALLAITEEVERLRDLGQSRTLGKAIRVLTDERRMPRKLRPNQTARELRHEYLHTTPAQRLRTGIELSHTGSALAARALERKQGKAMN
jgi:hypothetical protein